MRGYALLYIRVGARLGLATGHRSEFIALPVRLVLFGRQSAIGFAMSYVYFALEIVWLATVAVASV